MRHTHLFIGGKTVDAQRCGVLVDQVALRVEEHQALGHVFTHQAESLLARAQRLHVTKQGPADQLADDQGDEHADDEQGPDQDPGVLKVAEDGGLSAVVSGQRIRLHLTIEDVNLQFARREAARPGKAGLGLHLLADGLEPNGGHDAQRRQQDGEQAKAEPQRAARVPRTHGLRDHALGGRAEDARREEHEGRGRIQGHADESGQVTERFRPGGIADQDEAGDGRGAEREHIDHVTASEPGLDGGRGTPRGPLLEPRLHIRATPHSRKQTAVDGAIRPGGNAAADAAGTSRKKS